MIVTLDTLFTKDLTSKVIIFPTDTVYGIGCLVNDIEAIHRIYQIKQRDYSKPLAILGASLEDLFPLIKDKNDVLTLGKKYWPGALTLVVKKSHAVCDLSTSGQDTVGIRIPDYQVSKAILEHFGPMVVTSLNLTTEPAILKFDDVLKYEGFVDYIIDGGNLSSPASTVYDITNHKTLRQGDIIVTL
jgi:L-threonylcarbamoyladenylate synthase